MVKNSVAAATSVSQKNWQNPVLRCKLSIAHLPSYNRSELSLNSCKIRWAWSFSLFMRRGGDGCADLFSLGAREWLKAASEELQAVCQGNVLPWESDLAVKATQGSGTKPDGVQGALVQNSLIHGLIFKLSYVKSVVGLDDPHRSFPAEDILCSWVHFE